MIFLDPRSPLPAVMQAIGWEIIQPVGRICRLLSSMSWTLTSSEFRIFFTFYQRMNFLTLDMSDQTFVDSTGFRMKSSA